MALNFPSSPTVGQIFTDPISGNSYKWTGSVWKSYSAANPTSDLNVLNLYSVGVISATNMYVSGITTFASGGIITSLTVIGVATNNIVSGVTSTNHLRVVGFSTLGNVSSGVVTSSTLNISGVTTSQHLSVIGVTTLASLNVSFASTTSSDFDIMGKLGVGTLVPIAKVQINDSGLYPALTLPNGTSPRYSVGLGNTNVPGQGQRLDFYAGDSGSNSVNLDSTHLRLSLTSTGRFGVGQTNPSSAIHIGPFNGESTTHLYLASVNNLYGWRFDTNDFGGGSVPLRGYRRVNGTDTQFFTVLNSNGNVGIATTNPKSTFQVGAGVTIDGNTGIVSATSFYGSGANLTDLNITGLPSEYSDLDGMLFQ